VKEIDSQNTEIVRRVLASLLEKLESGSPQTHAGGQQGAADSSAPSNAAGGAGSVILLMLGNLDSGPTAGSSAGAEPRVSSRIEDRTPAHPGLEKFTVAGANHSNSAPGTCFMEPGRVCVNSGACELRGY